MLKKTLILIGSGMLAVSLAACSSSEASTGTSGNNGTGTSGNTEIFPVSEAKVINKTVNTYQETKPVYGMPTIAPGVPYTTTSTTTEYILILQAGEGAATNTREVSEFAFNNCNIGEIAILYSNGHTACVSEVEESATEESTTEESSESTTSENTNEETVVEETAEPEEEVATVPNGFEPENNG